MSQVFLGLGTNLGQRRLNLRRAILGLQQKITVTAVSSIYETEPWGLKDQPRFLNLCLAAITKESPVSLLHFIKGLEQELGRTPGVRWGPRLIDIDILFYDYLLLQEHGLKVPHPGVPDRAFVLAPLADIVPKFVHPQSVFTVEELLAGVDVAEVRPLGALSLEDEDRE